jgi:CysZ protein
MAGLIRELVGGAGLLGRGLSLVLRRPRLFRLGALPPLVSSLIFVAVLTLEITQLDRIVGWLTPFAARWDPAAAQKARLVVGVALVAGSVLIMVIAFGALTLTLGSPLYDKISEAVDREFAQAPGAAEEPSATALARGLRQSAAVIAISVLGALGLFLLGLVPVVGQLVVPVLSAMFGGWMLALELVGAPLERRGITTLAERRAMLRRRRARVLGFAVPTFLLLAVPFVSVVVFPVATAAATLLARELGDEPSQPARAAVG